MRVLVVFESVFGNTRHVAEAMAEAFGPNAIVTVATANSLDTAAGNEVDLLVVGAPTHAFGLPRDRTRRDAVRQAPDKAAPATNGVREWLANLPAAHFGAAAAVFDTRAATKPRWLTGSAAREARRKLARLGYQIVGTESFYVTGTQGPLRNGELARARAWAARLADALVPARG